MQGVEPVPGVPVRAAPGKEGVGVQKEAGAGRGGRMPEVVAGTHPVAEPRSSGRISHLA